MATGLGWTALSGANMENMDRRRTQGPAAVLKAFLHQGLILIACCASLGVVAQTAVATAALAVPVGEIEYARGVGFAQSPGQTPRTLGKGLPLSQSDRITTAEGATAIVVLQDGTRMTVRPNSELVLQQYQYQASANAPRASAAAGGLACPDGLGV